MCSGIHWPSPRLKRILLACFLFLVAPASCGPPPSNSTPTSAVATTAANTSTTTPSATAPAPAPAPATASSAPVSGPNTFSSSRVSGIAPLLVFFDATDNTSTETNYPFHELQFQWDFGDPSSGTWNNGAQPGVSSRNSATGPVSAHVFEQPGTYTVTLTVYDGTNTSTSTASIAVSDPNATYAGANTICVSAVSTPVAGSDGCPIGAKTVQQSDLPTILSTYLGIGKRVLLKAGDTFTGTTNGNIGDISDWTLGSFPTGSLAKISVSGGTYALNIGAATAGHYPSGGRVMDLEITGTSSDKAVWMKGNMDQLLFDRLNIHDIGDGFQFVGDVLDGFGETRVWDQVGIVDNRFYNLTGGAGTHGIFGMVSKLAVLGNLFDDDQGTFTEHLLRLQYAYKNVVSYNTFKHSDMGKEQFALRGMSQTGTLSYTHLLQPPCPTQYVYVSDNDFQASSFSAFKVGPAGNPGMTGIQIIDVISERNWYHAPSTLAADNMIEVHGSRITIRNEIIDMTNMRYYGNIVVDGATFDMAASDHVWIYNTTHYSPRNSANGTPSIMGLQTGVDTIGITNNLVYMPAQSGTVLVVSNSGGTNITQSNNSTNAQAKGTNPNFVSSSPSKPSDYKITATSYAKGAGAAVPVWADFFGVTEPSPRDMGAVNH